MARLRLSLLGQFALCRGDEERVISLPTRRSAALLAYLAAQDSMSHSRQKLAGLIWDNCDERKARHNLSQALSSIRSATQGYQEEIIISDAQSVAFNRGIVDVDLHEFRNFLASEDPLSWDKAISLYKGDFIAGLDLPAEGFENWISGERRALRELFLQRCRKLAVHYIGCERFDEAATTCLRLLGFDPYDEETNRLLMTVYSRQGRKRDALARFEELKRLLSSELDVEPEDETLKLYRQIGQSVPHDPPSLSSRKKVAARRIELPKLVVLNFLNFGRDAAQLDLGSALSE